MSEIRVEGQLVRQARRAMEPNGTAWLLLEVAPAADGTEAHARWRMGQGEAAQHACSRAASRMKPGTQVRIKAAGWRIKARRLELTDVSDVTQLDIPTPIGEPAEMENK